MPEGHTYTFNSQETDHSTAFMIKGDKVGFLAEAVFPPAGTLVSLVDGSTAVVKSSRLDISNDSGYAMVYVDMEPSKEHVTVPPFRVR